MDSNPRSAIRKNETDVSDLLPPLPGLSVQPCPIAVVRDDSTLNKRMSYIEDMEERKSFHSNKKTPQSEKFTFCRCISVKENFSDDDKTKEINPKAKTSSCSWNRDGLSSNGTKLISRRKSAKHTIRAAKLPKNECTPKNQNNVFCRGCNKYKQNSSAASGRKQNRTIMKLNYRYGSMYNTNKASQHIENNQNQINLNRSQMAGRTNSGYKNAQDTEYDLKKVYYSEKQSANVEDVPGAPPCTPNGVLANVIASLADIKSQRDVQQKLRDLRKREKDILEVAKMKAAQRDLEEKKKLMETQRRQIYAMNKILAQVEHENFLKSKARIQGLPV